jgi:hypothetical protein
MWWALWALRRPHDCLGLREAAEPIVPAPAVEPAEPPSQGPPEGG